MATASNAPRQRKSGADFTGRQVEVLEREKNEEKKEASQRMSMMTAAEAEQSNSIIDLTDPTNPVTEVQLREVEVETPTRLIRTNTTLKQVTYGREVIDPGDPDTGRPAIMGPMVMYDLEEGQAYKVPREFADHLNERGYLSYYGGV